MHVRQGQTWCCLHCCLFRPLQHSTISRNFLGGVRTSHKYQSQQFRGARGACWLLSESYEQFVRGRGSHGGRKRCSSIGQIPRPSCNDTLATGPVLHQHLHYMDVPCLHVSCAFLYIRNIVAMTVPDFTLKFQVCPSFLWSFGSQHANVFGREVSPWQHRHY